MRMSPLGSEVTSPGEESSKRTGIRIRWLCPIASPTRLRFGPTWQPELVGGRGVFQMMDHHCDFILLRDRKGRQALLINLLRKMFTLNSLTTLFDVNEGAEDGISVYRSHHDIEQSFTGFLHWYLMRWCLISIRQQTITECCLFFWLSVKFFGKKSSKIN